MLSLKNACTHAVTLDSVTNIIGNVGNKQRDSEKSKRNIDTTILLTKKDSQHYILEHNTNNGVSQRKIEFIQGMWPACPGKKTSYKNPFRKKFRGKNPNHNHTPECINSYTVSSLDSWFLCNFRGPPFPAVS